MFRICFEYDEPSRKWEVMVDGAKDETEAIQGFNAVLYTAAEAQPGMHHKAIKVGERYKLSIGI